MYYIIYKIKTLSKNWSEIGDLSVGVLSCLIIALAALCPLSMISGFLVILWAFLLFVHYKQEYGTFLQVHGVLALSWFGSIGLAAMRIHPLQQTWVPLTWISIGVMYPAFLVGHSLFCRVARVPRAAHLKKVNSKSVFVTLVLLFTIIAVVFMLEVIHARSLPIFSSDMAAYKKFGIKYLHYITVTAGLVPALVVAYGFQWGFRSREAVFLEIYGCILGFIPVLIVSRQLLLMEVVVACIVGAIASNYEFKINMKTVIGFIIACFLMYYLMSVFRNQDTQYIKSVFKLPESAGSVEVAFWQLYLYLCFGFDNFNSLVVNLSHFSFGASTGAPIIAFTLTKGLFEGAVPNVVDYRVLPTYTTFTMISNPYVDFGVFGVAFYGLLLGFGATAIEALTRIRPNIWALSAYGLVLYALLISFFVCEIALPVFWFYMFSLGSCYCIAKWINKNIMRKYINNG